MEILKKFTNLFLSPKDRDFRKAGIVGEDGVTTVEGRKVFTTWLLTKYGEEFHKEVVSKILEEQK